MCGLVCPGAGKNHVFASRVYDGVITQKVREQFYELTRKMVGQFLN
ncbi:Prophage Lp2 protein 6 [Pseudomonas chlororaphis subsp. aurantiaca]|nr:Prophage Lp2 protein 6 [Pseudomonas chlororaphis subsp. aurantiaca]